VKQEAAVNAAPNPRMVCAGFAGSTVNPPVRPFFAIFVQTIPAPAASRFPLLSVTSVCASFARRLRLARCGFSVYQQSQC